MKLFSLLIGGILVLPACQSQEQKEAKKLAEVIKSTIEKTAGFINTSKNGYWMKAKINGKEWTASAMLPNDKSDLPRIQGENNGEYIGFYVSMRGLEAGKHLAFAEGHAADLALNDDVVFWGGRKGEIVITKIDNSSMEGTFYFTANSSRSDKTIQVTDGYFRIPFTE